MEGGVSFRLYPTHDDTEPLDESLCFFGPNGVEVVSEQIDATAYLLIAHQNLTFSRIDFEGEQKQFIDDKIDLAPQDRYAPHLDELFVG